MLPSGPARLHRLVIAEQSDLEVHRPIDDRTVRLHPAVGTAGHTLGTHPALDIDAVDHFLDVGQNLTGELDLADAEGATLARRAEPTQEEAKHLPQCIDAETAGHHRIAFEMAGEEPKVRL